MRSYLDRLVGSSHPFDQNVDYILKYVCFQILLSSKHNSYINVIGWAVLLQPSSPIYYGAYPDKMVSISPLRDSAETILDMPEMHVIEERVILFRTRLRPDCHFEFEL